MRRQNIVADNNDPNPWLRPNLKALRIKLLSLPALEEDKAKHHVVQWMIWELRNNGLLLATIAREAIDRWTFSDRKIGDLIDEHGNSWAVPKQDFNPPEAPVLETAPNVPTTEDEFEKVKLWDNAETKRAVQEVIFAHQHDRIRGECTCGRSYEFAEQWAKHLRIRIFHYLSNTFAPD